MAANRTSNYIATIPMKNEDASVGSEKSIRTNIWLGYIER